MACRCATVAGKYLILQNQTQKRLMKVLKFGGTSVGTIEGIVNIRRIVLKQAKPVVVVVSALKTVTNNLIKATELAANGDPYYKYVLEEIRDTHTRHIDAIITSSKQATLLKDQLSGLFDELQGILRGVFLIKDVTPRISDAIVSYGERCSARIVAKYISETVEGEAPHPATLYDSREFILTRASGSHPIVDFDQTNARVRHTLGGEKGIAIVPGFIASDTATGITTTLGRGGSDYTAAIIAAALDAEALEIWTDVDGFMTADPRIIPSAYTIERLTYKEATELCNFGAKVIYPPTIFPVFNKEIPLWVKNTFRPDFPGSVITSSPSQSITSDKESADGGTKATETATKTTDSDTKAADSATKAADSNTMSADSAKPVSHNEFGVKGLTSINDTSVLNISALNMVGVIGINRRLFTILANNGISTFMVAQTSSETGTTMCLTHADALKAKEVFSRELKDEIDSGAVNPIQIIHDLATIAVVGEEMKNKLGVAGRLYSVLGRNGINVITSAQGAHEMNISVVIEKRHLRKALSVLHDSFFLSDHKVTNLFVCGVGTVGSSLLRQLREQHNEMLTNRHLDLRIVGVANSKRCLTDTNGLTPDNLVERLKTEGEQTTSPVTIARRFIEMNLYNSVFVDCTANEEVASLYDELLSHNISIVAANKIAASAPYPHYKALKQTALNKGVNFLYETNVGAGLPIIKTISDLRDSGDDILRIEAVLSGTLNFIFNKLSATTPFSQTIRMAMDAGLSEPDPRQDLCGKDVVRKLVILGREAGYSLNLEDVKLTPFVPDDYFQGDTAHFLAVLPELDAHFEQLRAETALHNQKLRFIAGIEKKGDKISATVRLTAVDHTHPFYNLEDSNNMVIITTTRYRQYPMIIQGYGAGADVTAAGVFADIIRAANI